MFNFIPAWKFKTTSTILSHFKELFKTSWFDHHDGYVFTLKQLAIDISKIALCEYLKSNVIVQSLLVSILIWQAIFWQLEAWDIIKMYIRGKCKTIICSLFIFDTFPSNYCKDSNISCASNGKSTSTLDKIKITFWNMLKHICVMNRVKKYTAARTWHFRMKTFWSVNMLNIGALQKSWGELSNWFWIFLQIVMSTEEMERMS